MNAESAAQETSGSYQRIEVRRITDALGAEVSGVNLSQPLDPSVIAEIRQALLNNLVICFRDQELSEAQLADFGRQFGSLEVEPFIRASNKEPGIHVTKGFHPDRATGRTLGWHMDHTYLEVPTWGIALQGIDVPQTGNDTLFANTYLSYEALAPQMQVFLSGLTAIHDICQYSLDSGILNIDSEEGIEQLAIMRKQFPKVEHPVICTHPQETILILQNAVNNVVCKPVPVGEKTNFVGRCVQAIQASARRAKPDNTGFPRALYRCCDGRRTQ